MNEAMLLWGLALLGAALLLIVAEVFIPSGGLIAIASGGCAVAGILCLFRYSTTWGLLGILTVVVLGPLSFGFALRVWPSTAMGRRMMGERPPEEVEAERLQAAKEIEARRALVGARGVALTPLRPVGVVEVEGVRLDALAEGGFIEPGSPVRVTHADFNQIKVRAVKS